MGARPAAWWRAWRQRGTQRRGRVNNTFLITRGSRRSPNPSDTHARTRTHTAVLGESRRGDCEEDQQHTFHEPDFWKWRQSMPWHYILDFK